MHMHTTSVSKKTQYSVKRDLIQCQKRPNTVCALERLREARLSTLRQPPSHPLNKTSDSLSLSLSLSHPSWLHPSLLVLSFSTFHFVDNGRGRGRGGALWAQQGRRFVPLQNLCVQKAEALGPLGNFRLELGDELLLELAAHPFSSLRLHGLRLPRARLKLPALSPPALSVSQQRLQPCSLTPRSAGRDSARSGRISPLSTHALLYAHTHSTRIHIQPTARTSDRSSSRTLMASPLFQSASW